MLDTAEILSCLELIIKFTLSAIFIVVPNSEKDVYFIKHKKSNAK